MGWRSRAGFWRQASAGKGEVWLAVSKHVHRDHPVWGPEPMASGSELGWPQCAACCRLLQAGLSS